MTRRLPRGPQDPPAIRSPSKEHGKFLKDVSTTADSHAYLGRRTALEMCNFLFLMSGVSEPDAFNASKVLDRFSAYAAGKRRSWHPFGDKIPKFSKHHCSTGTVLVVEALLMCKRVRL